MAERARTPSLTPPRPHSHDLCLARSFRPPRPPPTPPQTLRTGPTRAAVRLLGECVALRHRSGRARTAVPRVGQSHRRAAAPGAGADATRCAPGHPRLLFVFFLALF